MSVPPDTFLLIVVSCGICIIVIGMIVAVNCPLNALSCSFYCRHCKKFLRRIFCRKKEKKWKENIVNYTGNKSYGVSLVEGRPQGHGFYTSGPWSSTETTSTCFGGSDFHHIGLAAQTGLMGAQYYSMMSGSNNGQSQPSTTVTSSSPTTGATVYGNSQDFLTSPGFGLHGDNSGELQMLCVNCNGVGYIEPVSYHHFGSSQLHNGNGIEHVIHNGSHSDGGSSTGCVSSAADSAMASDIDADMIMCM